ncbi:molybdate ABC transporter substrate-binding protein [Bradyrhizobium prioriisuperbiae]|uniref:molybdate ABC transporter substrate-binding protein n=1 Tax=Bradyrhizobium prioriisuperbiae TaxID=2854389 RepID=UPI0028F0BF47|nr:substrate-binding domain-containing protein [Bradyrhizobium prioritasuperba]
MTDLKILSGGAAQGLVERLVAAFNVVSGLDVAGEFGAVGAMAANLRAGAPADLVILSRAVVDELAGQGLVIKSTATDIGRVETAVAVRVGDATIAVGTANDLRTALLAADEIFTPDTQAATAGIHFAKVLVDLGIADRVTKRLRMFPNGMTAMRHLSVSSARRAIGCTQVTEILNTSGVTLVGPLPPGHDLATVYTAAITTGASAAGAAQQLIDIMVDPRHAALRESIGFGQIER